MFTFTPVREGNETGTVYESTSTMLISLVYSPSLLKKNTAQGDISDSMVILSGPQRKGIELQYMRWEWSGWVDGGEGEGKQW